MLYVYGGRSGDRYYSGLTEVNLSVMQGRRVDTTGPGVRAGCALRYVPETSSVYLFGGQTGSTTVGNDLWRFSLITRTWQRLASSGTPGAPPAMYNNSLVTGVRDGSVTVVTGRTREGVREPLWMFRAATWKSFDQLMQGWQ